MGFCSGLVFFARFGFISIHFCFILLPRWSYCVVTPLNCSYYSHGASSFIRMASFISCPFLSLSLALFVCFSLSTWFIAELYRPEGQPRGAPYSYGGEPQHGEICLNTLATWEGNKPPSLFELLDATALLRPGYIAYLNYSNPLVRACKKLFEVCQTRTSGLRYCTSSGLFAFR